MAGDEKPFLPPLYQFEDLGGLAEMFDDLAEGVDRGDFILNPSGRRGAKLAFLLAASITRHSIITGNDYDQSEEGGG